MRFSFAVWARLLCSWVPLLLCNLHPPRHCPFIESQSFFLFFIYLCKRYGTSLTPIKSNNYFPSLIRVFYFFLKVIANCFFFCNLLMFLPGLSTPIKKDYFAFTVYKIPVWLCSERPPFSPCMLSFCEPFSLAINNISQMRPGYRELVMRRTSRCRYIYAFVSAT